VCEIESKKMIYNINPIKRLLIMKLINIEKSKFMQNERLKAHRKGLKPSLFLTL